MFQSGFMRRHIWPPLKQAEAESACLALIRCLLEGLVQPQLCSCYPTKVVLLATSLTSPRHRCLSSPSAHRRPHQLAFFISNMRPDVKFPFAAIGSWPLLVAELMLLNSWAIKLAQVKMIDFSFPFSSCKQ